MDDMMMELIAKIYGYMDDAEKASFTLEAAKEMVEDQIQIDKDHGRKPLEYDIRRLISFVGLKRTFARGLKIT